MGLKTLCAIGIHKWINVWKTKRICSRCDLTERKVFFGSSGGERWIKVRFKAKG